MQHDKNVGRNKIFIFVYSHFSIDVYGKFILCYWNWELTNGHKINIGLYVVAKKPWIIHVCLYSGFGVFYIKKIPVLASLQYNLSACMIYSYLFTSNSHIAAAMIFCCCYCCRRRCCCCCYSLGKSLQLVIPTLYWRSSRNYNISDRTWRQHVLQWHMNIQHSASIRFLNSVYTSWQFYSAHLPCWCSFQA